MHWPQTIQQPDLGLSHQHLQLAAEDNDNSKPLSLELSPEDETKTSPPAYDPEFPHLNIPLETDWDGLIQDSKLFLIYQVAVAGVIYFLPESVSKWSEEDKHGNIFKKWNDNVNNLHMDKDDWDINYIGHPYFGSVYYVRARHRGLHREGAFWYAFTMSAAYEYGIEALAEPASVQDLIFTPVGGAVMGEYFMIGREKMKRNIAARGYAKTSEKVLLFFTDPLGTINEKVNTIIGNEDDKQSSLELLPIISFGNSVPGSVQIQGVQALLQW
jgi:hypothetical protein